MNAGFENEFYLLKSSIRYCRTALFVPLNPLLLDIDIVTHLHSMCSSEGKEEWVPFDSTPYCSTASYDAARPLFHEIVASLDSLNIPVEQVRTEHHYLCC